MIDFLLTTASTTVCGACGTGPIEVDSDYLAKAWARETDPCPHCSRGLDYWNSLVRHVSQRSDLWHAVTLAGGYSTVFTRSVSLVEPLWLQFSDYGIPAGAVIYKVLQTPQGDAGTQGIPVLAHTAQTFGGQLHAQGIPLHPVFVGADAPEGGETEVVVTFTIVWTAPSESESVAQRLLQSAFAAYGEGDMIRSLIDADAAVDVSLRQLVTKDFIPGWNRGVPRMGLHLRLLILTAALGARGEDPLPEAMVDLLLKLNSRRNEAAHGSNTEIDPQQVAELITAALVGVSRFQRWHTG